MSELDKLRQYAIDREKRYRRNSAENRRTYKYKIRNKIFDALGAVCIRCGFSDIRALQLDHIKGNGRQDLLNHGGNQNMYLYYSKHLEDAKKELQVLCANCNWIKRAENFEHR